MTHATTAGSARHSPFFPPHSAGAGFDVCAVGRSRRGEANNRVKPAISAFQHFSFSAFPTSAFTLAEMLVVLGMIVILLSAVIPAVTSLSKANGRKAAIANLLGGIEQARAEAIKSGQATYVVFPTFTAGAQSTLDRYNYRSYAIFEIDPATGVAKQLTAWKSFPTGVALRAASPAPLSNLPAWTPPPGFTFTPDTSASPTFLSFQFNSNGEVTAPAANVLLGIFEGYVNSGTEIATTKDASGNPSAVEYVMVSQFTGRAEPTATPSP